MCEFCLKHGEGKKWYLRAQNYSEDLLADIRRRKFIEGFFSNAEGLARETADLERLDKAPPLVRSVIRRVVTGRMKRDHFGQVVPIEEIEQILGFVSSVVRVSCLCRHVTLGQERRFCYGISMAPDGGRLGELLRGLDGSFLFGPDTQGLESISREEALAAMREHEREGLCHTVWTFRAPFIGGICNCDRSDCLAMRSTVTHDVPVMFRAEYVAELDPEACDGCRSCIRVCQFGAITFSAAQKKSAIHPRSCYGCGVCRSVCTRNAIRLVDRRAVPAAAGLW
jgi:NAD-dependent dihydropyrimidine dehydrogenase PreA subunit